MVHHEGVAVGSDVLETPYGKVLTPERCVLEAASHHTGEVALCVLDSGLRSKLFDEETLWERHARMESWPFMRHLQIPMRMANGRAGSVGESRGRWWFRMLGLPAPELQWEVRGAAGGLLGVCDWAWPQYRLLGEFDGRVKYGRLLRPGQEPGDVVFDEKRREDLLREETQFAMVRLIWSDYGTPTVIGDRLGRWLPRFRGLST